MEANNSYKVYGNDLGGFIKKLFLILFVLIILCQIFFIVNDIKIGVMIILVSFIVLIGVYAGIITNQYSFYLIHDSLIVKNEYYYFLKDRYKVKLDEIVKFNYRFDNAPQYGTTHISIHSKEGKIKFKIKANLDETELLLSTLKKNKVPISFNNIQTNEQKAYAMKYM